MIRGFLTRPYDTTCGAFTVNDQFLQAYNQMLRGETIEIFPTELQYAVNKDIVHYRTMYFDLSKLYTDPNIMAPVFHHLAQGSERIKAAINQLPNKDYNQMYTQFKVPKRTGGFRTIDAPNEALKNVQRTIAQTLTYEWKLHPHEIAHAYVTGRSPKTCLEVHQANQSKWFLKLDIKDFFPSCSMEFVLTQLDRLYPLEATIQSALRELLAPCFLNGSLPQGGVASPLLSNLVMLPFDWGMRGLRDALHQEFVYTRYADDILISSKFDFDFHAVEKFMEDLYAETPFRIKKEKTRYGSIAGQNWNLGLMLNKDNNITVGTQRKSDFKHSVFNLLMDYKKGVAWTPEDKLQLRGMYSYLHNIEPDYTTGVIAYYEKKVGCSWEQAIKVT